MTVSRFGLRFCVLVIVNHLISLIWLDSSNEPSHHMLPSTQSKRGLGAGQKGLDKCGVMHKTWAIYWWIHLTWRARAPDSLAWVLEGTIDRKGHGCIGSSGLVLRRPSAPWLCPKLCMMGHDKSQWIVFIRGQMQCNAWSCGKTGGCGPNATHYRGPCIGIAMTCANQRCDWLMAGTWTPVHALHCHMGWSMTCDLYV
jgi:hypothetical protein